MEIISLSVKLFNAPFFNAVIGTSITTETKERIVTASKTGCGLKKYLNSPNSKLQTKYMLYKALMRPIVGYGSECWIISKKEGDIRVIYGPINDNSIWRRFIESQRLRWAAHVIRMDTTRTVKKLTEWEPCSSRPAGRPRLRWLDEVEEDLKKMKVRNWREKCKDRRLWNEIVKQAKTHQGL